MPSSLNVMGTYTATGGVQSSAANPSARWVLDATSLRVYDGTGNNYGAPSGAGVVFEATAAGSVFLVKNMTLQSATTGARWVLDGTSFRVYDGSATNYGAPSGAGVTFETTASTGAIFASKLKIQSAASGSYILLNAQGSPSAGVSPYISTNDGTRDRVQLGNLASYTDASGLVSAAAYGGRVLDASGNIIWDSSGISHHVSQSLGINDVAPGAISSPTYPTFAMLRGTNIPVTLSRTVDIMVFFLAVGRITAGSGSGRVRCSEGNGLLGTSGYLQFTIGTNSVQMGWRWYPAVAPNSYQFRLDAAVDSGVTVQLDEVAIQVIQWGQ